MTCDRSNPPVRFPTLPLMILLLLDVPPGEPYMGDANILGDIPIPCIL